MRVLALGECFGGMGLFTHCPWCRLGMGDHGDMTVGIDHPELALRTVERIRNIAARHAGCEQRGMHGGDIVAVQVEQDRLLDRRGAPARLRQHHAGAMWRLQPRPRGLVAAGLLWAFATQKPSSA